MELPQFDGILAFIIALRVNDGISSRMIIESPDAQYLQKHGDTTIFK